MFWLIEILHYVDYHWICENAAWRESDSEDSELDGECDFEEGEEVSPRVVSDTCSLRRLRYEDNNETRVITGRPLAEQFSAIIRPKKLILTRWNNVKIVLFVFQKEILLTPKSTYQFHAAYSFF